MSDHRAAEVADRLAELLDEFDLSRAQVTIPLGSDEWLTITMRHAGMMDEDHPNHPGLVVEERVGGL